MALAENVIPGAARDDARHIDLAKEFRP